MQTGTIDRKADAGSSKSRTAPAIPPATEARPRRSERLPWPSSSRRQVAMLAALPKASPVVFETFARTGG